MTLTLFIHSLAYMPAWYVSYVCVLFVSYSISLACMQIEMGSDLFWPQLRWILTLLYPFSQSITIFISLISDAYLHLISTYTGYEFSLSVSVPCLANKCRFVKCHIRSVCAPTCIAFSHNVTRILHFTECCRVWHAVTTLGHICHITRHNCDKKGNWVSLNWKKGSA